MDDKHRQVLRSVGAELMIRRRQQNMMQPEVAAGAGISVPYLSEIEGGRRNLSVGVLWDLSRALGVAPSSLLGFVEGRVAIEGRDRD